MIKMKSLQTSLFVFLLLLAASCSQQKLVRFGVCTDVHKDVMHDADERLQSFVSEMNEKDVDFIIQLGDFTQPQDYNASFMNVWNSFEWPAYHVLGNHDMDDDTREDTGGSYTRDETVAYYGMPSRYYSFDKQGFHFIVLDGNDVKDPPQAGYPHYISAVQMAWLKEDLSMTGSPVIVFSHQSLEDPDGVENAEQVRKILEEAKHESGENKVIACFSGHHHIDFSTSINGIHYIQINSMSYNWLGGDYLHIRYSKEIDEQYPFIKYTAPYKDPLYATVEIDSRGIIRITGRESTWVGPDPWELGYPEKNREIFSPSISNRELEF
jgi:3',5'-cyclic-AMP phosphodiesterase